MHPCCCNLLTFVTPSTFSGCELAGVVVTVGGAGGVAVRDDRSGKVLYQVQVDTGLENIWVGDTVILVIPRSFKNNNTVSCIMMNK